eukprot:11444835-Ditylum_brightwellii.AAC.2
MLPATIDPFSCEGPALYWFKFAHPGSVFHTTDHNFGNTKGLSVGKEMCCQATQHDYMKRALAKGRYALESGAARGKLFGETYIDTTPTTWSQQHLATCFTWAFSQHVLYCNRRHSKFFDRDGQEEEDIATQSDGFNKISKAQVKLDFIHTRSFLQECCTVDKTDDGS